MTSSPKRKTYPNYDVIDKKLEIQNLKFPFSLKYNISESLEGLISSLAQSAAELWLTKIFPERANHTFRVTILFGYELMIPAS